MKKTLSTFLILSLLLTLSATLVSCMHECEFSDEWCSSKISHWHECTNKGCNKTIDEADHTWDEGKITTEATQESDGVKTFTCTVCRRTSNEPIVFTGLSREAWNAAFDSDLLENFAYKEISTVTGGGVSVDTETVYKFTKNNAWVKITVGEEEEEGYAPDRRYADALRDQLVNSVRDIVRYAGYEYDAETKTYKPKEKIYIEALDAYTSDITVTFADGKLVEIKYSISFTQNDIEFVSTSTVTLSDYGTVVLNPPT